MKVITFLRHSKSSWDYDILDIHRPLSTIGIEKIKKIANSSKDHFISSEIISLTALILSMSATEVPPNFMVKIFIVYFNLLCHHSMATE